MLKALQLRNQTADKQDLDIAEYERLQANLQQFQQPTVILYPLVLPDRLELVLITPNSKPIHQSVNVKSEELNRAIVALRSALTDPTKDAKTPAQQLYRWLIQPIKKIWKKQAPKPLSMRPMANYAIFPWQRCMTVNSG